MLFRSFLSAYDSALYPVEVSGGESVLDELTEDQIKALAGGGAGGCFVASAAYGSKSHPVVILLTRFRDQVLGESSLGRAFIKLYYLYSPALADLVSLFSHLGVVIQVVLFFLAIPVFLMMNPLVSLMMVVIFLIYLSQRKEK